MPGLSLRKHQRRLSLNACGHGAGSFSRFRPRLPHQGGQHARLRERRLADPGVAEKNRQLVGRRRKRADHLGGFAASAEEEVRIGFGHGGKAAIGRGVPPQLARRRAAAGRRVHDQGETLLGCGVCGDDPVQLPQERQSRRRLTVKQQEHNREVVLLHAAVERFVVLHRLPRADALLANQQDEDCCLGDFPGELRQPEAADPQALRGKENFRLRVLAPERASRVSMSPKSCEL